MPRATYTDARFNTTRYYDSAGNELSGPHGEIKDWRAMDKEILKLKGLLKRIGEATNIKQVREIMAGVTLPKEM